jgi:UDP-glucuronate 4-epimerase
MKILITGAAGFIGFHLCKEFILKGHEVVGVDNINDYYDSSLKYSRISQIPAKNFSFIKADISSAKDLESIFKEHDIDYVVNLAAQAGVRYSISNPQAYIQSNLVGFGNILEMCRNYKVKHLIFASSSSIYGLNSTMPFSTNDSADHPVSLYAATKKSNELMAHSYAHLYDLPVTGLRFFTVYGPWGRPDMAYFLFTKAILEQQPIKVFNQGLMKRDFTYIDDIIFGITSLLDLPPTKNLDWNSLVPELGSSSAPYAIYNIGNNQPVELNEFISAIESAVGKKAIREYLPMQPGDVKETFADISPLNRKIGFKPSTSIQEGMKNFVQWYISHYS